MCLCSSMVGGCMDGRVGGRFGGRAEEYSLWTKAEINVDLVRII